MHENRETSGASGSKEDRDRLAKAQSHNANMHVSEEADCAVVPMNQCLDDARWERIFAWPDTRGWDLRERDRVLRFKPDAAKLDGADGTGFQLRHETMFFFGRHSASLNSTYYAIVQKTPRVVAA
jgi:hypothetical protein